MKEMLWCGFDNDFLLCLFISANTNLEASEKLGGMRILT